MSPIVHAGVYPHPPLVIPDIGGAEAEGVHNTAMAMKEMARRVKNAGAETVLVITPHGPLFRDAVAMLGNDTLSGSFARFNAGHLRFSFSNDKQLLSAIESEADRLHIRTAVIDSRGASAYGVTADLDHGTLVPLYFLHQAGVRLPLVHITFGMLSPRQLFAFGRAAAKGISRLKRRTAIVATADLSHRLTPGAPAGYNPAGAEFDRKIVTLLEQYNVPAIISLNPSLVEEAGECGYRSILICLGILEGLNVYPEVLSYEGPFGVGYMVADLTPKGKPAEKNDKRESEPVRLARMALETFLRENTAPDAPHESSLINERAGVFVSIKKDGQLRGCMGTIEPTQENLAEEIIENALSAGIYDPRFPAVTAGELTELEYTVDVLSLAEEVQSPAALDPKKYGIIVEKGPKRGLLLPDLAGVDRAEDQLAIALQKAGISRQENYRIYRFLVTRYY